MVSSLVPGLFGCRKRSIVSGGKRGWQEIRKWTGSEAKGLALRQNLAKDSDTAIYVCFRSPSWHAHMNGSVNTLLSAHRGDPEGPSERRQHSPAAERSHSAALRQPHFCNHGNHLGWRQHLPALPLPPRDAFSCRRNQTGIRAQLGALDSLQITW